jgi:putative sterol carrier protein/Fe-S-cluster-containing hydrogenase component 2
LLDRAWLERLCREAGADDVGFVTLSRAEVTDQREDILELFPRTKTLVSYVVRMHRESVRSPARSVANHEFHMAGDHSNKVGRAIVKALDAKGVAAVNPSIAFPMEVKRFPDEKSWLVAHKPIAVAAGLGQMGIHRNVIHPKFGSFVLLGTVLLDAWVTEENQAIDFNPCFECKLCVAACPVGAIAADGHFNFSACYTHNYREFLSGFGDWVETVIDSKRPKDYYDRISPGESASIWQSLSFGANYNAAYCMAVCPAGEDVIGPYTADRKDYLEAVVKPLQKKEETVYVTENSDARGYTQRRFPHKTVKVVGNGIRLSTIKAFAETSQHVFQRQQAKGLDASYHFIFRGREEREVTFVIKDQTLSIYDGKHGQPDVTVRADAQTWIDVLNKDARVVPALLTGKLRVKGPLRLLTAFGKCFG